MKRAEELRAGAWFMVAFVTRAPERWFKSSG